MADTMKVPLAAQNSLLNVPKVPLNFQNVSVNFQNVSVNFLNVSCSFPKVSLNFLNTSCNFLNASCNFPNISLNFLKVSLNFPKPKYLVLDCGQFVIFNRSSLIYLLILLCSKNCILIFITFAAT
jgi:hypothetical protein